MLAVRVWLNRAPFRHLPALLLVAVSAQSLFAAALDPTEPVRIDESEWITSGHVAFGLLRDAAPPARWDRAFEERALGDWGNRNPPLGKFVIGAVVTARLPAGAQVDYRASMMDPPALHRLPPLHVLAAARCAVAACAVLVLLASYLLALELLNGNRAAAVAPALLFLVPNFQVHASHVYTDIPQLAFLLFGSYGLLKYARSRRAAWFVLAVGCGGLGCAVKLSSGLFCVALVLYGALELVQPKRRLWPLMAAAVVPLAVFVAVNPYLYERPVEKCLTLVRDWQAIKRAQRANPQLAGAAVHGFGDGLALVSMRGAFAPASVPHLYSETTRAVREAAPSLLALGVVVLLALYAAGWRASLMASAARPLLLVCALLSGVALERVLIGKLTWYGGLCGLGLAGLAVELRAADAVVARAFALLVATNWLLTVLWLPFDWPRYYLPTVSLTAPLYALGLVALARCFTWTRHAPAFVSARRELASLALRLGRGQS